jgi:hypothetical protein
MTDPIDERLGAAFDEFDRRKAESERFKQQRKVDDEVVASSWKQVCAEVVRPTLDEIAEKVRARGHLAEVTEGAGAAGGDAPIEISFLPKDVPDRGARPHFRFDPPRSGTNDIQTSRSTIMPNRGGSSGPGPVVKMSDVTPALVRELALRVVEEVFAPTTYPLPENEPSRDW